jgi:chemotaxis family two-component system response regulator PixG
MTTHPPTLKTPTSANVQLSALLKSCIRRQLTGQLNLRGSNGHQWTLVFFMGRLIKAEGGEHPLRRWRRYLSLHCPQFQLAPDQTLEAEELLALETWDYDALIDRVEKQQIPREQAIKVLESSIIEVLFDLLQEEEQCKFQLSESLQYSLCPSSPDVLQKQPLIPSGIKYLWQQAQLSWQAWKTAGFISRSPNLAPIIRSPEQLEKQLGIYKSQNVKTLLEFMNGQRTLRDLAVKVGHNPLSLLKFLMPYIGRDLITLVSLPDLDFDLEAEMDLVTVAANKPLPFLPDSFERSAKQAGPLIAYVDDSSLYNQVMEEILVPEGYQFTGIQDSFRALPILLEQKPDLIFLDLVMPIVNGYELCAQIRRTREFQDTPIIIMTSNDTIVDRVRARLTGASDFCVKPFKANQLLTLIKKYLK